MRVNNECSMCGVKRVMLNGLRGEHTTILVDGVPTHSLVSSVYGLDATSAAGVERIEIARGAGASLIAPEAIGGTINLITKQARADELDLDIAGGDNNYRKIAAVGTLLANEDSTGITAIAQQDRRDQVDGDNNGVSENPLLDNKSLSLRISQDFGSQDNVSLRAKHARSEIFGGPMATDIRAVKRDYFADPEFVSEHLFADDDVRHTFVAKPWETAEWIESTRRELAASWLHEANSELNFTLTASSAQHQQDSFYEGFIYKADNDVAYFDGRINYSLTDSQHLTFGLDSRRETLRSHTNSQSPAYVTDSFNYSSTGIYLQDTWTANTDLEIAFALRADKLIADFIDPKKPADEIDQTLLSPRVDMRLRHSEAWNSRLSLGQGYRVPLSFFESDHGLLDSDAGFNIAIDRVERSKSVNYSLNYDLGPISATSSIAYTQVENLAQLTQDENDVPTLGQAQERADVTDYDIALTYKVNSQLSLSTVAETYHYNNAFKQAFSVAPIEQRLSLSADFDWQGLDTYISAVWIGKRDLTDYATPVSPSFDLKGEQPKSTQAAGFWTLDVQSSYEIGEGYKIYLGAYNLLNYTQVRDGQTPLFYQDGEFDVTHVYGPLRGREVYAGVRFVF
ncbi:MAG TPA: TonB-dependent receptor [Marinagarivorans sp.]|nr:TonB-dependent receptor [Marinagarivorans sp.]